LSIATAEAAQPEHALHRAILAERAVQHRQHDADLRHVLQPGHRLARTQPSDGGGGVLGLPQRPGGQRLARWPPAASAVEIDRPHAPTRAVQVVQHLGRRSQRNIVFRRAPARENCKIQYVAHRITPPR
jgi:hypothetical protein